MNEKIETTFGGTRDEMTMLANVFAHYLHAKEKHPYFCDMLIPPKEEWDECNAKSYTNEFRSCIKSQIETNRVMATDICQCEIAEMEEALVKGDTAAAIEECYDAIAVLLRVIDVLEGRQALGKPEEVKE
jgi:hypothetical protein